MTASSGIFTGRADGQVWLRIDGRGSHQNACELKAAVQNQIECQGGQRVIVDLSFCTGMDSTFMGTLRCISSRLDGAGGALHVIHAAGRNSELLRGLGLDQMFTVDDHEEHLQPGTHPPELAPLNAAPAGKQERTAVCLESHEALAAVDEKNAAKFRDVIDLMRGELRPAAAH